MNTTFDQTDGKTKMVPFDHFELLTFPSYITSKLEYFETGEGVTRGVAMFYAKDVDELRTSLIKIWGEYFASGCEATNGLFVVPRLEDAIPDRVRRILEGRNSQGIMPHSFSFRVTVHENYA